MMDGDRSAVFALLDDCDSTADARSSRLYTHFAHEYCCIDPAALDSVCASVAADTRRGLHVVVLGAYEFGQALQWRRHSTAPLRFLLFERCALLTRDAVDAWLLKHDGGLAEPACAGVAHLTKSVTRDAFDAALGVIQAALRAGDSYQINYTYRLEFDVFGTPLALYRRLRARQPVPYGALLRLPDDAWVLSCSPELFVKKTGMQICARPMKGTALRCDDGEQDAAAAAFLASDPKNRAENVMIVDLLRNDLAQIAQTGSVEVPALFTVEPYAAVWQMTSTVTASLRERVTFADVLRATFPCGSITGAPKHRTMQLIDELESTPRGLYTGALGWLDAASPESGGACGDFCLSVAIRTLTLAPPVLDGDRRGTMGVGAGIVVDSVAADEYAECASKARFLTGADPGFALFETMQATRAAGVRHLDLHLARARASAAMFGFPFDEMALRARIEACCAQLETAREYRVRLVLPKAGAAELVAVLLAPLGLGPVHVRLAAQHGFAASSSGDLLLRHKTTRRAIYDAAWRRAEALGGFDMLFCNERGELTEGARSNIFVKRGGQWWTPPLAAGVLPGVMRSVLLDDPALCAAERVLTLDDVASAEALLVCNALRGALPARLVREE